MPKHLAIDVNVLTGTAVFNNVKKMVIYYYNAAGNPMLFSKQPLVKITPLDTTAIPAAVTTHIKTGNMYAGFTLAFASIILLSVDWEVSERG